MRKRVLNRQQEEGVTDVPGWLPVQNLARVEVSSEDPAHPIEHALMPRHEHGWRAAEPGRQVIRLLFDSPQTIQRIYLHFVEEEVGRSQEFVLRGAERAEGRAQEIVRQQWNFSPGGSTHEIEDYRLTPRKLALLELEIDPARGGGDARASLHQFYLA